MKFDVDWLNDHLEQPAEVDRLADRLTACGFLVELRETVDGSEVWDVEITTNRPDAMNHRGLAREAAVATGIRLKPLDVQLEEIDDAADSLASVEIVEPELCPRYVARIVRGVDIVQSPGWLRQRLERCGVRPINAVVDATNYILLELGQPLHAFDLQRLAERRVIVRRAAEGENLKTLDEEERTLSSADLVIADADRAVALAGIMGGADSEIDDTTTDILIESAHFDALTVRRTARRLGMHTEASHRFERGSDPEMAGVACDAAAALTAKLTGGQVCSGRIDAYPRPWSASHLAMAVPKLSAFTGLDIAPADVVRIFKGLEFEPVEEGDEVMVSPPSHRVDIERVPDLYEEVIRHVGYDKVPSQLPALPTPPGHRNPNWQLMDRGRDAAVATGLAEIITWSFVSSSDDVSVETLPMCPGESLVLDNPLASTQSTLRRSLLPGLVRAARDNLNQGERSLALFEQGRVFSQDSGNPREAERLAVLVSGSNRDGTPVAFAAVKGIVEAILDRVSFPGVRWQRSRSPWLDDGEGAELIMEGGRVVGCVGLLGRDVARQWELKQSVYVVELDLTAALAQPPLAEDRSTPRFPSVVADMTIEHSVDVSYAQLEEAVRESASELVESLELQARYAGKNLPPNAVRTTLRLVYRHCERSLTQEEVNENQNRLRDQIAERLGVRFS
jgi:phenylalanyl-tRNA synthetase beta chain